MKEKQYSIKLHKNNYIKWVRRPLKIEQICEKENLWKIINIMINVAILRYANVIEVKDFCYCC